ncbi:MAG: hypothetical protein ACFWUC_11640 [Oscillospiraceae bacterium]|jgi:putative transposase
MAELLREYINSQHFSGTADVMETMKDMFRDVLWQVMKSELEEQLGYGKNKLYAPTDSVQYPLCTLQGH